MPPFPYLQLAILLGLYVLAFRIGIKLIGWKGTLICFFVSLVLFASAILIGLKL